MVGFNINQTSKLWWSWWVRQGLCLNVWGLLLFSSLAFLSLMNDDAEAWKCATPFVEALSEQEVRYLPPTMAGWHLMAKVGVGREEGGGRIVRTLQRSQHLCRCSATHCSRKACWSLSQRPIYGGQQYMGGNSWHMSGHNVAICFHFAKAFLSNSPLWRLFVGMKHTLYTVYIISYRIRMRSLLRYVGWHMR